MTKEVYDLLTTREKMLYDEFVQFSKTLQERIDALTQVTQALLTEAMKDPE